MPRLLSGYRLELLHHKTKVRDVNYNSHCMSTLIGGFATIQNTLTTCKYQSKMSADDKPPIFSYSYQGAQPHNIALRGKELLSQRFAR
jgi:hypothetical protein